MNLSDCFGIGAGHKCMISFAGGGGKTSTMFRLAGESKTRDRKVLVTTTTAIYYPESSQYDFIFLAEEPEALIKQTAHTEKGSITVAGSRILEDGKIKGIDPAWADRLFDEGVFDVILVEADGSRQKPIKAPDAHEPVIPMRTSVLAGIIGIDCYGKEIGPSAVHRPHILAGITRRQIGDVIDAGVIVELVLSPGGLFKNCPDHSEKLLFINKVRNGEEMKTAEKIGLSVLKSGCGVEKVVIGSVLGICPVQLVMKG